MGQDKQRGVEALAHGAYVDDGVKDFTSQLDDYAYGRMSTGDMFLVSTSSAESGLTECPDLPIVMRQRILRKVLASHELSLDEVAKLPVWLRDHPLALESMTEVNSLLVVTDAVDPDGREVLVALHLEKGYRQVIVNDVASIYGKNDLAFLIGNTIAAGRKVYVNERTGGWIRRTGVQFPERIASHLQDLLYQGGYEQTRPVPAGKRLVMPEKEPAERETPKVAADARKAASQAARTPQVPQAARQQSPRR